MGCYGVSTARLFAGTEPVMSRAIAQFSSTGVNMSLNAVLEFPGGVLAAIDCSFEQPFQCRYELVGTRGIIEVPDAYLPPVHGKPTARLRTIGTGSDADAASDRIRTLEFEPVDQYAAMVNAFAASLKAQRLLDPAEDGLAQMTVLEQLLKDAGTAGITSLAEHLPAANRFERIADVFDLGLATIVGPDDRHDVEPATDFQQSVFAKEVERGEGDPALFLEGNGLGWYALTSHLDLDEDQRVAVPRDQVDLTRPRAIAAQQYAQALTAKEPGGCPFAAVAQEPIPEGSHDRCHRSRGQ